VSETASTKIQAQSPQTQLLQMAMAISASRYLNVAAQLCLADHLADGPKSAEQLAGLTGTHAPSLYRFLRALTSLGLLKEDEVSGFSLTPLGEPLKTGVPGSVRAPILLMGSQLMTRAGDNLIYSIRTGKPGFEEAFGMPFFDWLASHPESEEASLFSEVMVSYHGAEPPKVASAYDFSHFGTIVDVGGATGHLLTTILGRYPGPRGILFDMPHVVRDAPALIHARGLADRISVEAGSFLTNVPGGGDAYLLSHIIHDWSESQSLAILANCRRAMRPDGRLLIVEMVLPSGDVPFQGARADIGLMVLNGGQERTEKEYRELLDKAGFRPVRVVPTDSAVSIVEAFPV
jgi:SAM-dependent methyltransferase